MSVLKHYLCIGCPLGCQLEVEAEGSEIRAIRGFSCRKGEEFARVEHTDPRRMVTTTVRVRGGAFPRVPVKTEAPVPKDTVDRLCEELHRITVDAPVNPGDVILYSNSWLTTNVVATREVIRGSD